MRISDWSSDVCSSDLHVHVVRGGCPADGHDLSLGAVTSVAHVHRVVPGRKTGKAGLSLLIGRIEKADRLRCDRAGRQKGHHCALQGTSAELDRHLERSSADRRLDVDDGRGARDGCYRVGPNDAALVPAAGEAEGWESGEAWGRAK